MTGADYNTTHQGASTEPFVLVKRELLALAELCPLDAAIVTHANFEQHYRRTVSVAQLVALSGCHRSTVYAALARLRERGWLDAQNRPGARRVPPGKKGFLKVEWSSLRELGGTDSQVLEFLASSDGFRKMQREGGKMAAPPGLIASGLGMSRDTARTSVRRLESGATVRQRLAERRAKRSETPAPPRVSRLRLERVRGDAPRFVVRTERQRAELRQRAEEQRAAAQRASAPLPRAPHAEPPPSPERLAELVAQGALDPAGRAREFRRLYGRT